MSKMNNYFRSEKLLREKYGINLLEEIILKRDDRAIYFAEHKEDTITFQKIHGKSPFDEIPNGPDFSFEFLEANFDLDSKYGEVAGKQYYKNLNLNIIRNIDIESNTTIPIIINGSRRWVRFHSYTIRKNEQGKPLLAGCYITEVTKYLIYEEALYEKTHKDELTRLFNRYALYYHFSLRGNRSPIVSYYFDIDDFKQYNDTYGHDIGDVVLEKFSSILLSHTSDKFYCYRLGGDEFYCLLHNAEENEDKKYLTYIQEAIHSISIPKIDKKLSISVGVVSTKDDITHKYEPFMKHGDKLMYESKKKGKNTSSFDSFKTF